MRLRQAIALAVLAGTIGACAGPSATPSPSAQSKVPCGPSEVLTRHEHAHLVILIRGQIKTVPAFIGIAATSICWLHTHDTSGIIHIEADDYRPFTLGDFFAVWGQPLSRTVIDGERSGSSESVQVTVDQQPYSGSAETIVLKNREDIVLQLGPQFVQTQPYLWPPGY